MDPGAVSAEADTPDPRQHSRDGPMNDAKPKQPMFEMPTLLIPGHDRPPPRAGTQLVTDWFMDEPPTLPTSGAWQAATEGWNTAGIWPVHGWTTDPANSGAWQAATEGRNTAGNRLVHGWTTAEGRNTAGNRPVHEWTADAANPGAWQAAIKDRNTAGNRPVHGWTTAAANPGAWQAATEGRNTTSIRLL